MRLASRLAMKLGRLSWEQDWLKPLLSAKRAYGASSGEEAVRFLVRVDEFPYYSAYDDSRYGIEASRRFHSILAGSGVMHLMSIVPQLTHAALDPSSSGGRPLGPDEIAFIELMRSDGVTFAQHGTTHRTRDTHPRRQSELCGLSPSETVALLDRGRANLDRAGVHPRVFVPPFNRFDARQYPLLADRFDVVCGGPESVALMGFHGGPLWRQDAVYLPCYHPLYGTAAEILPRVLELIELQPPTWVPIVLHTGWEVDDDFRTLPVLAESLAPYAVSWADFLADIEQSRTAAPAR